MKKYLISLVAIAAMLLSSACSKEETPYIAENGDMVTFNIAAPEMGTRAYSDGMTATDLKVAVYQGGTYRESLTQTATLQGGVTTVSLPLVTGVTYDIVFWAQANDAPYNFDANSGKVSVDYTSVAANNEDLDAFYANKLGYTVEGAKSETIYLTRPFAQLNVATLDYALATDSGIEITQTAIEVEGIYTSFNLLDKDGKVEGNTTTITLSKASTPSAEKQKLTGYEEYTWLSMNYLLVDAKTTVRAKMETNESAVTREWFNIPVQRNYRTNILGNILTTTTDFNVIVDERFLGDVTDWDGKTLTEPAKDSDGVYRISTAEHLAWIIANNPASPKLSIDANINFNNHPVPVQKNRFNNLTIIGNGHTIKNYLAGIATKASGDISALFPDVATATVENLIIENAKSDAGIGESAYAGGLFARTYGTITLNNVKVIDSDIKGTNKVGGLIGFVAENGIIVNNCRVENTNITTHQMADESGLAGGLIGMIAGKNQDSKISNSQVSGGTFTLINSRNNEYRANSRFIGSVGQSVGSNLYIDNCSAEVENYTDQSEYVSPYGVLLGGNRGTGRVFIDGKEVVALADGITLIDNTYNVSAVAGTDALTTIFSDIENSQPKEAVILISDGARLEWKTGAQHGSTPFLSEDCPTQLTIDGNGTLVATGSGVGPIRLANSDKKLIVKNITIDDESVSYAEDAWEFTYLEIGDGNDEQFYFENVTFLSGITLSGIFEFKNCSFKSEESSVYSVWFSDSQVSFDECSFTGTRGLKIHEAYGSEVESVIVKNCTFEKLTEKPGIAIGTLNAETEVSITNSKFIDCQKGDQGLYIYETDTDVNTFDFSEDGNTVILDGYKLEMGDNGLVYVVSEQTYDEAVTIEAAPNQYKFEKCTINEGMVLDGTVHALHIYESTVAKGIEINASNTIVLSDVAFILEDGEKILSSDLYMYELQFMVHNITVNGVKINGKADFNQYVDIPNGYNFSLF